MAPQKLESRVDDRRPFRMPWIDSCYQETLLPAGPWQKVEDKMCKVLAGKVEKQLTHPKRRQVIFELLGKEFVQKYYPEMPHDPTVLDAPETSVDERRKLLIDAQNWLNNCIAKVAVETTCQRPKLVGDAVCEEVKEFVEHAQSIVTKGLERHLHLQEQEFLNNLERSEEEKKRFEREIYEDRRDLQRAWQEMERLRHAHPSLKGILKNPLPPPSRMVTGSRLSIQSTGQLSEFSRPVTANVKGVLLSMPEDPPALSGMQSDSVGRSVIAVLKRDPRRFTEVVGALLGRQLPAPLRTYIWMDVLLKAERHKLPEGNAERVVRERFGKSVSRGVSDLGTKRANHSPIASLIDNAVIEKYDGTPAMKPYIKDNDYMKSAARALNILYTYDRSYEPYLIYWLFPLQLAYQDAAREKEHVYELAMYVDLLNRNCFPSWPQIFGIAESVMNRIAQVNPELEAHMVRVAAISPRLNEKEFMVQLLLDEKQKSQVGAGTPGSRSPPRSSPRLQSLTEGHRSSGLRPRSSELLAHPLILLRKWIGEGFVGVLDTAAVLYVWDQFFMSDWSNSTIENVCLVLLQLISYKLMEANDFTQLKDMFLREPCKLYTKDIQRGFIHLQRDGDAHLIPGMNRRKPAQPEEPLEVRSPTPPPPTSTTPVLVLDPVGIKNIRLEIAVPYAVLQREPLLDELDVEKLTLECAVYFGSVQMATRRSTVTPVNRGTTVKEFSNDKIYKVTFKAERFTFDDLNLSDMDVEQELGGYPQAVISVKYRYSPKAKKGKKSDGKERTYPIGWTRIKLYHHKEGGVSGWRLMSGDCTYRLYPGTPPDNVAVEQIDVTSDILERTSTLGAVVYDPRNELKTPSSSKPGSKAATPKPRSRGSASPNVPGLQDKFNLYIDALDNIPDNASVVKVTGVLLNCADELEIQALPESTSSARNPRFHSRTAINGAKQTLNKDLLVLLKIYTVDRDTQEVAVMGCCLFKFFTPEGKLKVGGHKRRLHSGMLDLSADVKSNSLDEFPALPATTISIRLTAYTEDHVSVVPEDESAMSDLALTESERRLIQSHRDDTEFPATVTDATNILAQQAKQDLPNDPQSWIEWRLDEKTQLPIHTSTGLLDILKTVRYRQHTGVCVKIHSAQGVPEGLYTQCFARVLPGGETVDVPVTTEGWGGEEKFITLKHDYNSLQVRPEWLDDPTTLHPHHDVHSVLMIQLFGVDMFYRPTSKHDKPGLIKSREGALEELGEGALLGWTVLPIYKQLCVNSGRFTCPIIKGKPDEQVLSSLTHQPVNTELQKILSQPEKLLTGAAVTVSLWDGHFTLEELPYDLKVDSSQLDHVSDLTAHREAEGQVDGKRIHDFVLDPLDWDVRKLGTESDIFKIELEFHKKASAEKFIDIFEKALMEADLGPLK